MQIACKHYSYYKWTRMHEESDKGVTTRGTTKRAEGWLDRLCGAIFLTDPLVVLRYNGVQKAAERNGVAEGITPVHCKCGSS